MKKYRILKLIGLAILTMIILVGISFLEVAIYSYVINPGQDASVYDAHAMDSAPYISAIFGFIIFCAHNLVFGFGFLLLEITWHSGHSARARTCYFQGPGKRRNNPSAARPF